MAQLLVRNIDDALKEELKESARENGRSLESEVRERLRSSVRRSRPIGSDYAARRPDTTPVDAPSVSHEPDETRHASQSATSPLSAILDQFRGMGGFEPGDIIEMGLGSIVGVLDRPTRRFYAERAIANGRTMHEEISAVLADEEVWAVLGETAQPDPNEFGLGSDIVARFSGRGVHFDEEDIARMEAYREEPLSPPVSFE